MSSKNNYPDKYQYKVFPAENTSYINTFKEDYIADSHIQYISCHVILH